MLLRMLFGQFHIDAKARWQERQHCRRPALAGLYAGLFPIQVGMQPLVRGEKE